MGAAGAGSRGARRWSLLLQQFQAGADPGGVRVGELFVQGQGRCEFGVLAFRVEGEVSDLFAHLSLSVEGPVFTHQGDAGLAHHQ